MVRNETVRSYLIVLCGFFVAAKFYVRFNIFRSVHARPAFARHNEALKLIDLLAWTAWIAVFFLLVNGANGLRKAIVVGTALAIFDGVMRYVFLEAEVRRLRASSSKWSYRDARRHVRKRAAVPMFQ